MALLPTHFNLNMSGTWLEALPGIIQTLLQEGYTFVPISQIILTGDYTIDHTGRQCPAKGDAA